MGRVGVQIETLVYVESVEKAAELLGRMSTLVQEFDPMASIKADPEKVDDIERGA
jgi:hypothetical protein